MPVALFVLLSRGGGWLAGNWQGISIFLVIIFVSTIATDTKSPRVKQPGAELLGEGEHRNLQVHCEEQAFLLLIKHRS